jgi:glycosyltransferase involved in cell wall biosynthesis
MTTLVEQSGIVHAGERMADGRGRGASVPRDGGGCAAPDGPLGARWRAERELAQEAVLPSGRVVVSCAAALGAGGLGRHLQEILDALERRGQPSVCICGSTLAFTPPAPNRKLGPPKLATALAPLTRFSPSRRILRERVAFDAEAARRLPAADHLIAFNRQALAQFQIARQERYRSIALMSGSPHVRHVARQHARAYRQYPLERSFGTHIVERYLLEYEQADRIHVACRYTWESFVEQGVPEEALSLFPLTPDPRYGPDAERLPRTSATFDIVYSGSLTVAKGVPLLVDAVRRLSHPDIRLVLVGGWRTRGMRRFIQRATAEDSRIEVSPGDPLPHLRAARLCVHPTYEDGFAYAPAEALACGVPVLVSEDTGMKELIDPGGDGLILPTGDLNALTESIEAAYRGELFGG